MATLLNRSGRVALQRRGASVYSDWSRFQPAALLFEPATPIQNLL